VQGGRWTAVHLPPCTGYNIHIDTRHAATSPAEITKYLTDHFSI
jgi:hypothetical protein